MLPTIVEQIEAARQHALREASADPDAREAARIEYRRKWESDRKARLIEVHFRANKARDRVLDVITSAGKAISRAAIIAGSGLSDTVVEDRIDDLIIQSRIARVRRGWYIANIPKE